MSAAQDSVPRSALEEAIRIGQDALRQVGLDRADLDELRRHICLAIGAVNSQSQSSGTRREKANAHLQNALDVLDALREGKAA